MNQGSVNASMEAVAIGGLDAQQVPPRHDPGDAPPPPVPDPGLPPVDDPDDGPPPVIDPGVVDPGTAPTPPPPMIS